MRRGLVILLALALPGGASGAGDRNRLVLSGALRTSSARAVDNTACGYRARTLSFMSGAMLLGHGPAVVRVIFDLRRFHGVGKYGARRPRVRYGNTPLRIVTAAHAASGAGAAWPARRGRVHVRTARYEGGRLVSAAGSVQAACAYEDGVVRLRGTWRCSSL